MDIFPDGVDRQRMVCGYRMKGGNYCLSAWVQVVDTGIVMHNESPPGWM